MGTSGNVQEKKLESGLEKFTNLPPPQNEIVFTRTRACLASQRCAWRRKVYGGPGNYLGDLYRRWKARLGTPKAITAMAHKLARIIWHLLKHRTAYDPSVWSKAEEKLKKKRLKRLEQNASTLGYNLVCAPIT